MKWPQLPVESIRAPVRYSLVGGPFGSELTTKDYVEEGVPVIRGNNLPNDRPFHDDDFVFVREEKADALVGNNAYPGDVVFTQRGTLGQVGIIPTDAKYPRYLLSQSQMKLTVDPQKADPRFIFYFFRHPQTVQSIKSRASSSGVPHINLKVLRTWEMPVPHIDVQRRVVTALGRYDDLIENNRRRMNLLEDTARHLYQEWFVRLRFPGHERTRIVDGAPERWERKRLGDICVHVRESVLPEEVEPDTPYIGLEHMPRRSISLTEWGSAGSVTSSKNRYVEGDVLFGKIRPYFHKVGIAFTDGVASSDAIVIRTEAELLRGLVLLLVSSDGFVAQASQTMREGSKMPRADWKLMAQYPVACPPHGVLASFSENVRVITKQLRNLCFQNRQLRVARDLLLPRLMSGEIQV